MREEGGKERRGGRAMWAERREIAGGAGKGGLRGGDPETCWLAGSEGVKWDPAPDIDGAIWPPGSHGGRFVYRDEVGRCCRRAIVY